jgi:hypothetical protein
LFGDGKGFALKIALRADWSNNALPDDFSILF